MPSRPIEIEIEIDIEIERERERERESCMALSVHWYDFLCFAIVGVAALGSLWIIVGANRFRQGRRNVDDGYVSLAASMPAEDRAKQRPSPGPAHVGAQQLWGSCWRGVHPGWLLGVRLVSLVAMVVMLVWDILRYDLLIFVYYTEWTFALVIVYFALGTLISAHGCWIFSKQTAMISEERNRFLKRDLDLDGNRSAAANSIPNNTSGTIRLQSHEDFEDNEQRAGFWGYAMQVIYQTSAGAVILTDVVFWGLIVPFLSNEHFTLNLLMGCMHSLNFVFLLLDTALNSLPFPWFRMAYFVLWSCVYVIFQWILHACGFSWWPYPFLELETPWAPLWYFCMALVHIPCYAFYTLIVKAKNTLFSKWFPDTYIRSY